MKVFKKALSILCLCAMLLAIACIAPFSADVSVASAAESTLTYEGSTYINPVAAGADPYVLKHDGTYYMYCTNAPNTGYVVYYSDDLVNWHSGGYCLRKENIAVQPTASFGLWAPEVYEYNGTFYMLYTSNESLAFATSSSPLGPFTGTQTAMFPGMRTIDGHLFFDDDGKVYFYYVITKQWENGRTGNRIYGAEFDMSTLSLKTTPVELIAPKAGTWEWAGGAYVAEGPEMLKHNGKYYLSYSCNGYADHTYAIGYATSSSPLGTYTRYSGNPILKQSSSTGGEKVYGPGHHCFTTSPDGNELFIVYHRHASNDVVERNICIDRASFDANGVLSVTGPTATPQAMPSGASTEDYTVTLTGEFAALTDLPEVFVHEQAGSDGNAGTMAAPLETITAAYNKLKNTGGTITLLSHYTATHETDTNYWCVPKVNGPILLRGINPGIRLSHGFVSLNSPHYIDNIFLRQMTSTGLIEARFNSLIIGERVSTSPSTTSERYTFIVGGHMQYDDSDSAANSSPYKYFLTDAKTDDAVDLHKDYTLEVYGGTWRSIRAGNWRMRSKAYVGVIDADITLKIGGTAKVIPYKDLSSPENYAVSVTGNCSLKKGNTARLIITGGTFECSVFVAGRLGGVPTDTTVGYEKFIDGNLEFYASNATFKPYVYNGGSKLAHLLAKQEDVPEDMITGDYLLELSGNVTFPSTPIITATGVLGNSVAIRTKAHKSYTYKNFKETYYANFVDYVNGDDSNDGTCPEKALKNISKAFTDLPYHGSHTVLCDLTMTNSLGYSSSYERVFRSSFAGIDHKGISLTKNNNIALSLKCPLTLDKLRIDSQVKNASISLCMSNATVTEDVICTVSGNGDYPLLVGGRPVFNVHEDVISDKYNIGSKDALHKRTVNVNGGTWSLFIGGNYRIGTESSVGTLWEDLTVNIGGNARFTRTVKPDDIASTTFAIGGMNIQKGSVTLNITGGTFETPVYGLTRMGELASNRKQLIPAGLWGEGVDLTYDLHMTLNISGGDFTKAGKIGFASFPGETPIHGNATLNITGGTFAGNTIFSGAGVAKGNASVTGLTAEQKAYATGFDTVNGVATGDDELRILCIGDSITFGTCSTAVTSGGYTYPKENFNYPTMLEKLYAENGVRAEVVNCGFGGSIASLQDTNLTYRFSGAYNRSLASEPDIIVIALGTNNYSRANFDYGRTEYEEGMADLIETYHAKFPEAKIYITTAMPRFKHSARASSVVANIIPLQKKLASAYPYCELIDLYTAMFDRADLDHYASDKLHPNNKGYAAMASEIYKGLNGKALSGSSLLSDKLSTVYVSANGTGDGSSAGNATYNISLAMGRLPDRGGTIVVVDSITLTEYFFTDPRLKALTVKGLTADSEIHLNGTAMLQTIPSVTFEDITLVSNVSLPYIFAAGYNDLTFGEGVTCVRGTYTTTDSSGASVVKNVVYDPLICAGHYVVTGDSAEFASSDKDCRITVNGGSWNLVRGGNTRSASSSKKTAPMGVYSGDLTVRIGGNALLTSSSYQDYATYVSCATGMNYHQGSATMILDGITAYGGIYGICRPNYTDAATTPGYGISSPYSGSVTIILNNATVASKVSASASGAAGVMAVQDITASDFTGDYTLVLINSKISNSIASGNSANNVSTLKTHGTNVCTPIGFTSSLVLPKGDAGMDGKADIRDVALVERHLAGWKGYEDYDLIGISDLNLDGTVNIADAAVLTRHLAGWEDYKEIPLS